jgi:hypothetical protein
MECIVDRTRTYGQVQVLVDGQRWRTHNRSQRVTCSQCGSAAEVACYADGSEEPTFCVKCVVVNAVNPRRTHHDGDKVAAINARGAAS